VSASTVVAVVALGVAVAAGAGALLAWWLHRFTRLSPRNLYVAWGVSVPAALAAAAALREGAALAGALVVMCGVTVAALCARRSRLAALGAGGELREFERSRVMAWTWCRQRRRLGAGDRDRERVFIASEGELVRKRAWPVRVPGLPMTGDGRALVPLGEGMHLFFVGATGSGKTTSARRWLLARGLGEPARTAAGGAGEPSTALLVLDPKGDDGLERDLYAIAAKTGRPFVVFDPYDPSADRWNPVWADDPGAVVARLVAPVEAQRRLRRQSLLAAPAGASRPRRRGAPDRRAVAGGAAGVVARGATPAVCGDRGARARAQRRR
jgi:hypothetical protein